MPDKTPIPVAPETQTPPPAPPAVAPVIPQPPAPDAVVPTPPPVVESTPVAQVEVQSVLMYEVPIIPVPEAAAMPSPHDAAVESMAATTNSAAGETSMLEQHHAMGTMLTSAIDEGKRQVPTDPDPLMVKPNQLESWRVFKIMSEFVEGFDLIRKYSLAATFFGSARETFEGTVYQNATDLAAALAAKGFAIITGGSAGIMQAANRGAFEAGGASIGLNIKLDDKQGTNKYVTDSMMFDHFFVRKVMLTYASSVYIYFPGGYGTLDEFTEILTLVQTKKIRRVPIVLFGKEYWAPLVSEIFEKKLLNEYHAIDAEDLDLFKIVDSVSEAMAYIESTMLK